MTFLTQTRRLLRFPFISINRLLKQQEQSVPKLLLQIFIIQFFFYINFIILWKTVAYLLGYDLSNSILAYSNFTIKDARGATNIICWLINSLITSFLISVIVGRSKLAWDFALTVHIINLILSFAYNKSLPTSVTWWIVQLISSLLIIFLGTYMSRFRELRDTFFDELLDNGNNSNLELSDLEAQK
ncbi:hypothetical protein QEN19_001607 [Hanseniaspora menglaensis]